MPPPEIGSGYGVTSKDVTCICYITFWPFLGYELTLTVTAVCEAR